MAQLVEAYYGNPVESLGTIAQQARRLNGIRPDGIAPIADAWWAIMARTRGGQTQPRLLVLRTAGGRICDDTVEVVAGPGRWYGSLVAAAGGGAHCRPVWWHDTGERRAAVPEAACRVYGPRASLVIDAGAAAAVMLFVQAQLYCKTGMHPRNWPGADAADVDIDMLRIEVNSTLGRRGIRAAESGRWDAGYVMVVCGYPDAVADAHEQAMPAAQMVLSCRTVGHIDPQAQHIWMVAADPNSVILGRVRKGRDAVQGLNLLGTGGPAAASRSGV